MIKIYAGILHDIKVNFGYIYIYTSEPITHCQEVKNIQFIYGIPQTSNFLPLQLYMFLKNTKEVGVSQKPFKVNFAVRNFQLNFFNTRLSTLFDIKFCQEHIIILAYNVTTSRKFCCLIRYVVRVFIRVHVIIASIVNICLHLGKLNVTDKVVSR